MAKKKFFFLLYLFFTLKRAPSKGSKVFFFFFFFFFFFSFFLWSLWVDWCRCKSLYSSLTGSRNLGFVKDVYEVQYKRIAWIPGELLIEWNLLTILLPRYFHPLFTELLQVLLLLVDENRRDTKPKYTYTYTHKVSTHFFGKNITLLKL